MTNDLPSRSAEFWRGVRDSLPMLIGVAPVGMIFGALAVPSGLSSTGAALMSILVFAGSSQFIAKAAVAWTHEAAGWQSKGHVAGWRARWRHLLASIGTGLAVFFLWRLMFV